MRLKDTKRIIPVKKVELEHFVIVANMEKDLLRKVAFRLGKVFDAYKAHFGVDRNAPKKVHVVIFNSMQEYYDAIGRQFMNPAFYSPERKVIWAGFGLAEHKAVIKAIRKHHAKLNGELEKVRSDVDEVRARARKAVHHLYEEIQGLGRVSNREKALIGKIMKEVRRRQHKWEVEIARYERRVKDIQREIELYDRKNDIAFNKHTEAMVRAMYHEGFHAFLDQFLFDEELVEHVPRWLNEGLAQYFENARVEAGRLILGQEDRGRMSILRRFKQEGSLISIEEMVAGDAKSYLVHEIGNVENSTKHYLMAWCVVHLLGEKGRLTKENLEGFAALTSFADSRPRVMRTLTVLAGMTNADLQSELDARLEAGAKGEVHGTQ